MHVAIGSDHAGFALKEHLASVAAAACRPTGPAAAAASIRPDRLRARDLPPCPPSRPTAAASRATQARSWHPARSPTATTIETAESESPPTADGMILITRALVETGDYKEAMAWGERAIEPGAGDPRALWQLLRRGVDGITEVPPDRWDVDEFYDPEPATPSKMNTRWGGFLERVDLFDPAFFGISQREAERMDPQQRLLLEVTHEALEDAGVPRDQVEGTRTSVFIGSFMYDYLCIQSAS